ncbi:MULTISPECIES: hypothetical protein [unclassified Corynebacterium]|uniref:hypothetical protein n=1 Tax=unclassified Corynebacterium TaxID=2624378 RepID=UPI0029CA904D|nr:MULTISPECIES: hypothetical protein [unclassified Corynebacterium]WPF66830.1 hypothetical protein OLX12_03655 [Corynebacterium sp. 22KM0430]WPF69318.1 hypothetical protein OLW90_03650 [Corynebacterium sp. 21KM1197]
MSSLPRAHVFAPFLLMAVGGFLATVDLLRTSFPVWQHLSVALHEGLWLPGTALVGLSVLLAVLTHPRGSMLHTPVHPRAGVWDFLAQAGVVAASSLIGYAVGLLPVLIRGARYASWGHVHFVDVIIAVAGIALLVGSGYAVGMLAGRMMMIPLAMIVTFLLLGITVEPLWRPWGLVVPVRGIEADTRFVTSPFTAIFAVLATAVALVFLSHLLRHRLRGGRGYFTWGLALCAVVTTAFVWRPEIYVVDPGLEQRCHEVQGTQVCLHAAHLPAQADVDEVVARLQRAGLGESLREVNDRSVVDRDDPRAGEAFVDIFTGPFSENTIPASTEEGVAYSAVNSLITHGCVWSKEDAPTQNRDAVMNLRNNALYLAGYEAVLDDSWSAGVRFSAQEVASIMARHAEDIDACRWDGTA